MASTAIMANKEAGRSAAALTGFRCDWHCHVLPGMDDGSKSPEMSLEMLRRSAEQGIQVIAATPHYYPRETVDHFLRRRERACMALMQAAAADEGAARFPQLLLGAEVAYHTGLVYEESLPSLCIGDSNYILIEMPFYQWTPNILREVESIASVRGLQPVIAHLERYFKQEEEQTIEALLDSGMLIQMNVEYLLGFFTYGRARRMLETGAVHLLGSDSHNLSDRAPNLGAAYDKLQNGAMRSVLREIDRRNRSIYQQAIGEQV